MRVAIAGAGNVGLFIANDLVSAGMDATEVARIKDRANGDVLYPDNMEVLSWPDSANQLMRAVGRMRSNEHFWSV